MTKREIKKFESICKEMGIDINQTLWRAVDLFAIAKEMHCEAYHIMYYLKYERRNMA
jgi:hypothetical protein